MDELNVRYRRVIGSRMSRDNVPLSAAMMVASRTKYLA